MKRDGGQEGERREEAVWWERIGQTKKKKKKKGRSDRRGGGEGTGGGRGKVRRKEYNKRGGAIGCDFAPLKLPIRGAEKEACGAAPVIFSLVSCMGGPPGYGASHAKTH